MIPQLFLLEFHVGKIKFEPTFLPVPTKEQIEVNFRCANLFDLDIDVLEFPVAPQQERGGEIDYNLGISHLFCQSAEYLISEFKVSPLEIRLFIEQICRGTGKVRWIHEFMGKLSHIKAGEDSKNSIEYGCEVEIHDTDISNSVICKIQILVRICGLGDTIDRQFHVTKVDEKYRYYFQNAEKNATFKVTRIRSGDLAEAYSIFNPVVSLTNNGSRPDFFFTGGQRGSKISQPRTEPVSHQKSGIPLTEIFQHNSGDSVSMCFHIQETKFFDWLNYMSVEADNVKETPSKRFQNPIDITAEEIASKLCGHKDCPGVLLFKELGIGITEKGMIDEDAEVPVQVGLSHIDRRMSAHGPTGIYSRPKRLTEPFVPPRNVFETTKPPCTSRKPMKCMVETKKQCPGCSSRSK